MRRLVGIICAVMALASCGTSPEPDYYTLAPVPGTKAPDLTAAIKIDRPTLPGYLDRPDIVRQSGTYRIDIDESRRWAAPLDTMVERILAEDLRRRMPNAPVMTELDDVSSGGGFVIETDIENFNGTDRGAVLTAQLTVNGKGNCAQTGTSSIPFHALSANADLAAGLSDLIGQMADEIVARLRERNAASWAKQP